VDNQVLLQDYTVKIVTKLEIRKMLGKLKTIRKIWEFADFSEDGG